jgi:hypothetical protein
MTTCKHCHDNPATDLQCDTIDGVDVILYEGCNRCWNRLTDTPVVRAAINAALFDAKMARIDKSNEDQIKYIQTLLDVHQLQKEIAQLKKRAVNIDVKKIEPGGYYMLTVAGGRVTEHTVQMLQDLMKNIDSQLAVVEIDAPADVRLEKKPSEFSAIPPGSLAEMRAFLKSLKRDIEDGSYINALRISEQLIELCGTPKE